MNTIFHNENLLIFEISDDKFKIHFEQTEGTLFKWSDSNGWNKIATVSFDRMRHDNEEDLIKELVQLSMFFIQKTGNFGNLN